MLGGILLFNFKLGDEKNRDGNVIFGILKGILLGVLTAAVSAFVFTFVALMNEDPDKLVTPLAYVALAVGTLTAGIAVPKRDMSPIVAAALSGGGYALVMWLASLPYRAGGEPGISPIISLLLYLGCVVLSVIGGLVFRKRTTKVTSLRKSPAAAVRKQLGHRG